MYKSTIAAGGPASVMRIASAVLVVLVVSGCGFHLQGRSVLPDNVERMAVLYDNDYTVGDPEVVRVLKQRLRQRDQLGRATAPAVLRIVRVAQNQRTIAVSPAAGPETDSCEPLARETTRPPTMPVIRPDSGGAPEAIAIPRHSGIATKNTTIPARRSRPR